MPPNEPLSAQVILRTADLASAERVREEFRRQQFEVGPLVANNFAISGSQANFARYFGEQAVNKPRQQMLPLDSLPSDVRATVQAIGFATGYQDVSDPAP
jgi:hypothetical protein